MGGKINFLTEYEIYATKIYYYNKEFTPKEIIDYFTQTSEQSFADKKRIKKLVKKSKNIFNNILNKHNLTLDKILTAEISIGAKALTHLALIHYDMCRILEYDPKDFDNLINIPFSFEY